MAIVFDRVAAKVCKTADQPPVSEAAALRQLDRRARTVLGLFSRQETITAPDIACVLGDEEGLCRSIEQ